MAPETLVYSLYQVQCSTRGPSMLLVRVPRPSYRNASQPEEDWAYEQEDHLRDRLLAAYQAKVHASCGANCSLTLHGICEGNPPGDILYEDHGQVTLALWVAATRFGRPWILLGVASTEEAFFAEIMSDTSYASYQPERPARQVEAYFITEADEESLRKGGP